VGPRAGAITRARENLCRWLADGAWSCLLQAEASEWGPEPVLSHGRVEEALMRCGVNDCREQELDALLHLFPNYNRGAVGAHGDDDDDDDDGGGGGDDDDDDDDDMSSTRCYLFPNYNRGAVGACGPRGGLLVGAGDMMMMMIMMMMMMMTIDNQDNDMTLVQCCFRSCP
jgi:hypothetical protein